MKYLKLFENFGDRNYTINPDGSIDVDGSVDLSEKRLTKLPLKFGKVTGDFYCYDNQLTTLEGAPREVGGHFYCHTNQLTTLEGAPREVGGGGYFGCNDNPIYSVYQLFPDHKSFMDSLDYSYLRGTDIVKSRFQEALDELNIEMSNKINGYRYI